MWALHHEFFLFQKSRSYFSYVPENEIEGDILGWTTSKFRYDMILDIDLLTELGLNLKFFDHVIEANDEPF